MTLQEAMGLKCFDCKATLKWSGYKGYEHLANCCGFVYTLKPRVAEYELEISKSTTKEYTPEELARFKESGIIPGKDGGLFHHPI